MAFEILDDWGEKAAACVVLCCGDRQLLIPFAESTIKNADIVDVIAGDVVLQYFGGSW